MSGFTLPSIRFPFLGTREGGDSFEYLFIELTAHQATIAISRWFVNYSRLHLKEQIELFFPFSLSCTHPAEENLIGFVESSRENEETGECWYTITPKNSSLWLISIQEENRASLASTLQPSFLRERFLHLLKDSIILKEGLLVYLKHFAPYFSRIVNLPQKEYAHFEKLIFKEIAEKLKKNSEKLKELYLKCTHALKDIADVSLHLNLDDLRELIESEINLDLFLLALSPKNSAIEAVPLLKQLEQKKATLREEYYIYYLLTIKKLEKNLYLNYNQIVLIYAHSLI